MISIALYARVSSAQQAQRATIDSQVAALRERAAADGHRISPEDLYLDDGFSGTTLLRPGLERLRDRVAEGAIDLIYVHSPDRLARRYAYQVVLLEEFAARGVRVVFLLGASGQTAEETLLTQVQGMVAEYERARLMERYRRGKLHRARQGLVNPLSGAPYGYRYVARTATEPARYEVVLAEAEVVRGLFEGLVHRQQSIAHLVRELNAAGVPTRRGAPRWDRSTVWGVLRNPAYAGEAAYGKTESVTRGQLLRPIRNKPGTPRRAKSAARARAAEQWISIPVPALVTPEVFAAAREQLERNKRLSARNARGHRYLLQGLVVCASCGYAYYGKSVSPAARKGRPCYAYYRCVGSDGFRFAGGRVCHNPQMRVDPLDAHVWDAVRATLEDPERVLNEWVRRAESDRVQVERRAQRDAAAQVVTAQERSLTRLLDAYEAGALDLPELTARSDRLKARLTHAREALEQAETQLAEIVTLRAVTGRLEDFAARVRGGLEQLSWEERRDLIRLLVARVEIDPEGATVVFRLPTSPTTGGPAPTNSSPAGSAEASCHLRGRREHPALRRAREQGLLPTVLHHPSLQPEPQQLQHPAVGDAKRQPLHQHAVIQRAEEVSDVRVEHEVASARATFAERLQRIGRAAAGSKPERAVGEVRFEDRLQHQLRRRLHDAIAHRRDPERPLPAVGLGDVLPQHRARSVRACAQRRLDLVQERDHASLLDRRDRLSIDARGSLVGPNPLPRRLQHVTPEDAVIQGVEAPSRLPLGGSP